MHRILKIIICLSLSLILVSSCSKGKSTKLKIGDKAPSFAVQDIDDNFVSMDNYKGNPVVLRFWSTDCKYCRADTPIFNEYFNTYKRAGLKVVYINNSSDIKTVRDFVEDLEIQFPVVLDADGKITASYNVKLVPQTIIISPEQKILAAILGGVSETELKNLIGPYLP